MEAARSHRCKFDESRIGRREHARLIITLVSLRFARKFATRSGFTFGMYAVAGSECARRRSVSAGSPRRKAQRLQRRGNLTGRKLIGLKRWPYGSDLNGGTVGD